MKWLGCAVEGDRGELSFFGGFSFEGISGGSEKLSRQQAEVL